MIQESSRERPVGSRTPKKRKVVRGPRDLAEIARIDMTRANFRT
jgi:hypothetical protein